MKLPISLAATLALVAVLAFGTTTSSSAIGDENAVGYWSGIAQAAIAPGPARPPASSSVLAAMVHGAMYDAVAAIEGGLEPFATDVSAPANASVDAAVAQAARDVLVNCMNATTPATPCLAQAQKDAVETALTGFLATISAGKDEGVQVGAAAAAGMLALRANSGFGASVPYAQVPPAGPGVFVPIAATPVVDVMLAKVRPFTYETPAYRPDPPYALTSNKYERDLAEVKATGSVAANTPPNERTQTARFFQDHTFRQYSRGLRRLVDDRDLDVRESARLLGYTWVAIADTMIACWDAKFAYMFWRPTTAIQLTDPTWTQLITGNHPEYPSGHACFTAALTQSLHTYFGTKEVTLTLSSEQAGAGPDRTYTHLDRLVADVEDARVWGGLHYRTTMTETAKDFPRIARDVGKHYFLDH